MKVRIALISCCLLAGAGLTAYALTTQSPEEMQKWEEFRTPGDAHKVLDAKVGKWNLKVKMTMAPKAEPIESVGTSETKWTMDGRFLEDRTEGTSMGRPFHSASFKGFDNLKKKYVGSWIDNQGTGISVSEGTYDVTTKSFTHFCTLPDPNKGLYMTGRSVEKWIDKDHWTMTLYAPGEKNREYVSLEIDYTRAK